MPPDSVLENIKQLKIYGYREVVLSGVHLGEYGLDFSPPVNLFELLNQIHQANLIDRVRISSIEPHELTDNIIQLVAKSGRFCRHFHIPLQSGDDQILKNMHRPYTRSYFKDLIYKIHKFIPDAAIGLDILMGFPGETQTAFENTCELIKELPVSYLHVFPFSLRKGTAASNYPDKVPAKVIQSRCRQMRGLGYAKKELFYKKHIGRTVGVLIESKRDNRSGFLKGISSNYLRVLIDGDDAAKNAIVRVKIETFFNNDSLLGTISS
jgi:threonylcarbamoyladenosine tRNA methylthiotransferase MtaB